MVYKVAPLALVAVFSTASFASAEEAEPASGEASIRPMEVTCSQLLEASGEERDRIAFYIAGYHRGATADVTEPESSSATAGSSNAAVDQPAGTFEEDAPGHGEAATSEPELAGAEGVILSDGDSDGSVSRAFFAGEATDLYKACEDNGERLAHEVIQEAQLAASGKDAGDQ